jgi:Uma2 family endonuclease
MSQLAERVYTAEEYLALEREADHKSEFVNGRIYAMSGASFRHTAIVSHIVIGVGAQLVGGSCGLYFNDLRVKVSQTGMYTYPDIVALCEPPELEDEHFDTLLNPTVIFEVLSDSTERYDRGEKFAHYRKIESLREYILVAQDKVRIERFVRHGEHWTLGEIGDPEGVLRIETLGCEIALRDVYQGVKLAAGANATV